MTDIRQCREIYKHSFGEEGDFETLLFCYCGKYIKSLSLGGETVSFCFVLPCEITANNQKFKCGYIFAAATKEEHRNKGYMSALLEQIKKETAMPLILRPATVSLVKYYKKFDFCEIAAQDVEKKETLIEPVGGFKKLSAKTEKSCDGNFTLMAYNFKKDLNGIYFPFTMP